MVKGCSNSCIQVILFVFNFIFVIIGAITFGFGTYILTKSSSMKDIVDSPDGGAIMIMITGSCIFLISFFGCFGAIKENECLLKTYGIIVGILALLQIAGASLLIIYTGTIDDAIKGPLKEHFESFNSNKKSVNLLQYSLQCCGYDGPDFWTKKSFNAGELPTGCCKNPETTSVNCNENTENIFKEGCKERISYLLKTFSNVSIVAVIFVAIIQMVAACFACMLANAV